MTPELERLERLLRGYPEGLTRARLRDRLDVDDRAARKLVEAATASGHLPIVSEAAPGDADGRSRRYRLAGANEHDAVNRQCAEDVKRAISLLRKARGRRLAHERMYGASMFLDDVPVAVTADDEAA